MRREALLGRIRRSRKLMAAALAIGCVVRAAEPVAAQDGGPEAGWLSRVRRSEAAPAVQAPREKPPRESTYDRIWGLAEWYENDAGAVVQRVLFTGRYQHDFAAVRADQGNLDEWNVRRMRLGLRSTLFRAFTVHGEVDLNPQEADPLLVRATDLYVQWSGGGRLALTAGKQGAPFTMDGSTSSKELLAIDRSNLSNNLWFSTEYVPGVSVSGRIAPWTYRAGVYSAGRANRGFGTFDGGAFALGVLGYDFAGALDVGEALLSVHYVHQRPDERNTFTRPFEHVASVNFRLETGRWGARTDVAAGWGYLGQPDLRGVMFMPFLHATDRLQLTGRYTFLHSGDVNGIRLPAYESGAVPGRGDRYRELYAGASYFLHGHKLKLQSGVQIARMDDRGNDGGAYAGASWTAGLRVGW